MTGPRPRALKAAMWAGGAAAAAVALVLWALPSEGQGAPSPGSAGDPLVSESYVAQAISQAKLGANQAGEVESLSGGGTLTLPVGSEVVLLSGSVEAPAVPQLVDLTAGAAVDANGALAPDHLVLAIAPQVVMAGPGGASLYTTAPPATGSS